MSILFWLSIFVLGGMSGYFTVQFLVQEPAQTGIYAVLTVTALISAVLLLVRVFKGKKAAFASLLLLIGLMSGYLISNAVFLARREPRELPQIVRTDGGDGHTAILYFTHGEPPGYDAQPWIETIREFDHDNVPFVPWVLRPIFFNTVRHEYALAGGSAHNKLHETFIDNLRRAIPEAATKGTRFYLAFLDSNPRPDEMTIQAINDGASRIVVLPVFVTESTHTLAGMEMVSSVGLESYGIPTCYTGALWDSDALQQVFVERANEMLNGESKSQVGILLVGHGQPTEWENLYPAQNRQEDLYREGIRNKLLADGYMPENVRLGWMDFQEPSITESVQNMAERGLKTILVFATSMSASSIHSDVDIPLAVEAAKLPEEIQVKYVGQYGDHPLAIQAMQEKISNCEK